MEQLQDNFGRVHDYLRISLTDKCNLRCIYCMPNEHYDFMRNEHLMSPEEIESIARIFVAYGVKRIRLTGGEPLVRKAFPEILERLSKLPVKLALTTNGIFADKYINQFKAAGLKSVNISFDTLQPERFKALSQRDHYTRVWDNVQLLMDEGFKVKLNVVVMKGKNSDEVIDFVALTQHLPIHVRFIEFMPFDGNKWELETVHTHEEMLATIEQQYDIVKLADKPNATAKSYHVPDFKGTFAVISTVSEPFCSSCNRMRLTADGKMRNCLFATAETDLLTRFRKGEDIYPFIRSAVLGKAWKLGGLPEFEDHDKLMQQLSARSMIKIGG